MLRILTSPRRIEVVRRLAIQNSRTNVSPTWTNSGSRMACRDMAGPALARRNDTRAPRRRHAPMQMPGKTADEAMLRPGARRRGARANSRTSPAGRLGLAPLLELAKQRFLVLSADVGDVLLAQEPLERVRRDPVPVQVLAHPVTGGLELLPSGNLDVDARFHPLGMARRLVEFVDLREEGVDELGGPAIAFAVLRPVEAHQQDAGGNRLDDLAR